MAAPATPPISVVGEITFDALGQTWTAVSGFIATLRIEQHFDEPSQVVLDRIFIRVTQEIADDPNRLHEAIKHMRMADVVGVFTAMLSLHHPDIDELTVAQIIQDQGYQATIELLQRALRASAAPADEDDKTGNQKRRPPVRPKK